jgi:hypothetical protein
MSGKIVNCQNDTRHLLTRETKQGDIVSAALADMEGNPIQSNGVTYVGTHPDHVEVFLDTISGGYFARVSMSAANDLRAKGKEVFQGVGGVPGWFVPAPDFTINGRNGGGKAKEQAQPQQQGEKPQQGKAA